jgi:excisionase family DNA binding protein
MSQAFTSKQPIFTVAEVASSLRISDETIRRKILSGELKAIELSSGSRTTFRILGQELVRWLGANTARQLFGLGEGLLEIEKALSTLEPTEREELISAAIAAAKAKAPARKKVGRVATQKEIALKFPNKN